MILMFCWNFFFSSLLHMPHSRFIFFPFLFWRSASVYAIFFVPHMFISWYSSSHRTQSEKSNIFFAEHAFLLCSIQILFRWFASLNLVTKWKFYVYKHIHSHAYRHGTLTPNHVRLWKLFLILIIDWCECECEARQIWFGSLVLSEKQRKKNEGK